MEKDKSLITIGSVAKFLNVTTTTIRYYEEYGLITPTYIDKNTLYRYYDNKTISRISYIISLRSSGLSMQNIKEYIDDDLSINQIIEDLKKKKDHLNRIIEDNENRLTKKDQYKITEGVFSDDIYFIERKLEAKTITELTKEYFYIFDEEAKKCQITLDSKEMTLVYFKDSLSDFQHIDASLYFVVEGNEEGAKLLPKYKYIKTYHRGSYDDMYKAYEALGKYALENNLTLLGDSIESYRESFNLFINQEHFLTEVFLLIKE